MIREIKFRSWNPERKVMTAGHDFNTLLMCTDKNFVDEFQKISGIWIQYTGMLDKNGKEIYDGDLFKNGSLKYPYIYEVYWHENYQWSGRIYKNQQFTGPIRSNEFIVPEEMKIEIIGNIYEHKHLLK